jgi:hypothetical protein
VRALVGVVHKNSHTSLESTGVPAKMHVFFLLLALKYGRLRHIAFSQSFCLSTSTSHETPPAHSNNPSKDRHDVEFQIKFIPGHLAAGG